MERQRWGIWERLAAEVLMVVVGLGPWVLMLERPGFLWWVMLDQAFIDANTFVLEAGKGLLACRIVFFGEFRFMHTKHLLGCHCSLCRPQ